MKILAFLKKNIKYVLIVGAVIFVILWFNFKQGQIRRLTEKIITIEMANFALNNDRDNLEIRLKLLQNEYSRIEKTNDSLKLVLGKYQLQLVNLKKEHEREIAELLKIPSDTAYKRISERFPNYDNTDQRFRFASSQIIPIYSTVISFEHVKQEYSLQTKSLNTCLSLNDNFELGIANLNKQVAGLQENIGKADSQIGNYQKEVKILNNQINKKTFWNRTLIGAGAIAILVAVIK